MNSAAELKRYNDSASFNKAKAKITEALENDPLGLSVSQLMTVCRLGIKTVKEVLASIEASEEQGVYFIKSKPPKIEATHKQAPVIEVKPDVIPEEPNKRRFGLQAELLALLQKNKDGLSRSEILEILEITEKQFGKALWEIKKTHEIIRTGDFTCFHYQLIHGAVTETQPPGLMVAPEVNKTEQLECEDTGMHMSALNKARSRIKTTVTTKFELALCKEELTDLLIKLFALDQVEWQTIDGQFTGVHMSTKEVT